MYTEVTKLQMSDDSREVTDVIAMNWCLNKQKSAVTKHTNCSMK